jgi:hypothetical protein
LKLASPTSGYYFVTVTAATATAETAKTRPAELALFDFVFSSWIYISRYR